MACSRPQQAHVCRQQRLNDRMGLGDMRKWYLKGKHSSCEPCAYTQTVTFLAPPRHQSRNRLRLLVAGINCLVSTCTTLSRTPDECTCTPHLAVFSFNKPTLLSLCHKPLLEMPLKAHWRRKKFCLQICVTDVRTLEMQISASPMTPQR